MPDIDWNNIFDEARTSPGATDDDIDRFLNTALAPLSPAEIEEIRASQSNPYPESDPLHAVWKRLDPAGWTIPDAPFPPSYLSLLRWTNGGECRTGENWFMFFPANDPVHGVRAMMLGYYLPEYLPGFVPFAFDGCGTFYLFDMRQPAVEGEYPIVCCHAGELDPPETAKIAEKLLAACQGRWEWEDVD